MDALDGRVFDRLVDALDLPIGEGPAKPSQGAAKPPVRIHSASPSGSHAIVDMGRRSKPHSRRLWSTGSFFGDFVSLPAPQTLLQNR